MVRNKGNKPKQGLWNIERMRSAVGLAKKGFSIRQAAERFGIPKSTLHRRLKELVPVDQPASRPLVFTKDEESQLVGYIMEMSNSGFGLSIKDICCLSFEMAVTLNKVHPFNTTKKEAGYDWYQGFMKRHPQLSLRKPEALSAVRASMLNKNVVSSYFNLLTEKLQNMNITDCGSQIYNVDETGMNTVHQPGKVVGPKGRKNVHSKTSADREENVTAVICVSAGGHYLPPMLIFKGQRLNQGLIANAPVGTLFGTSKSSFIDRDLFQHWFRYHFLKHLPAFRPVLLILDGHSSHVSLAMLQTAKQNNIEILCLPPHTTSELQPLDKCVFKPLKAEYNKQCSKFLKENPCRVVSRYDFCGIFKGAYQKACTFSTAASAFRKTGICPLNPGVISEDISTPSTTSQLLQTDQSDASTAVANQSETTSEINSAPSRAPLKELFKVPKSVKSTSIDDMKKCKQVGKARCLTETEFLKELEQKEKENQEKALEKERRIKEREVKKIEKENKKKLNCKKNKQKTQNVNETNPENDPANYCTRCNGYYFDDDSDDGDWIRCSVGTCNAWCHETCTGLYGQCLALFKCEKHTIVV